MANKRPNVLVIFTDQQRHDTIAALGNPVIRTPALDRLAREGVAFTSAYSPSPVCISARCSMIYGQYPQRTGCYENTAMPTDGRPTFMAALTAAGYRTHGIGKVHFSPDRNGLRGFQSRQSQEEGVGSPQDDDYLKFQHAGGFSHITDPHGVRGEMYYIPQVSQVPARLHPTQWIGDQTVKFIQEQAGAAQPWMLFSSYIHPHPPFAPPAPWHKLYRAPLMPLPKTPQDCQSLLTYINRHQNRYKYRDQGIDQNLLRNMKAYYYAAISFIDCQIGRTLEALAATGQIDNTLILFTSDHGEMLGDYNCFGKRCMLDGSARVCLLARLPGRFEGGRTCDVPANLVDLAPTILAATGAGTGLATDGADLADLSSGASGRAMVFSQHSQAGLATYMAVSGRWKYFYSAPDNRAFLFDRVQDGQETRNRSGLVFCRDAEKQMKAALIDFLRQMGETAALDGEGAAVDWRAYPRRDVDPNPDAGLLVQDSRWADVRIPGYSD